jgi:hypothetical protein
MNLYSITAVREYCGFLERASGHFGDYTTGRGTFCSDCGGRVFNPYYRGAQDVESDMEIVDKLRKSGTKIPKKIQREIVEFQDKVNWKPRWEF